MSTVESEAIWKKFDRHAEEIANLRVSHESLAGRVDAHMATTEAIAETVKMRAIKADAQHNEIMTAIHELRTDKSERDGMAKLGRGVAIFIGAVAAIGGIILAALSHRGAPP
jgi:hypothetical protein